VIYFFNTLVSIHATNHFKLQSNYLLSIHVKLPVDNIFSFDTSGFYIS